MMFRAMKLAYRELIDNPSKQVPFWMLVGFLPTFALARFIVHNFPGVFLQISGTHIHHFAYGIFVLSVTGFVSLILSHPTKLVRQILAIFYGVGLALSFDEFGMWLHLVDRYDIELSEYIMAAIIIFLVGVVYGVDFFRHVHRISTKRRRS